MQIYPSFFCPLLAVARSQKHLPYPALAINQRLLDNLQASASKERSNHRSLADEFPGSTYRGLPKRTPKTEAKKNISAFPKKSLKVFLSHKVVEDDVQGWESDSEIEPPVTPQDFPITHVPISPPKTKNEKHLKGVKPEGRVERDACKKKVPARQCSPKPCVKRQVTKSRQQSTNSMVTQLKPQNNQENYYKQYVRWKLREKPGKVDVESLLQRCFQVGTPPGYQILYVD